MQSFQGETKTLDLTIDTPKKIPSQSSSPPSGKGGNGSPEFFDEPQFTVAGVTDGTNLGGHGSNTIVRTKDALAKDIASLSGSPGQESRKPVEAKLRAEVERQPDSFEANHRLGESLVDDGKASEALVLSGTCFKTQAWRLSEFLLAGDGLRRMPVSTSAHAQVRKPCSRPKVVIRRRRLICITCWVTSRRKPEIRLKQCGSINARRN